MIGQVAHVKDARVYFAGADAQGYTELKADPGTRFAVILVGVDELDHRGILKSKTNAGEALQALGWTPPGKPKKRERKA